MVKYNKNIHKRIHLFLCYFIAFLIPFKAFLSPVIILFVLNFIFLPEEELNLQGIKEKKIWIALVYFFLHLIGLLYTENMQEGLTNLEVKLTFLLFPIIFCLSSFDQLKVMNILKTFILGCFGISILLLLKSFLYFIKTSDTSFFFYTNFSDYIHPSYLAMYFNLALIIILCFRFRIETLTGNVKLLLIAAGIYFSILIILCSSKMGIACLALTLTGTFIYYIARFRDLKVLFLSILGFFLIVFFVTKYVNKPFQRFQSVVDVFYKTPNDKTSGESTTARYFVWQSAKKVISRNIIVGVSPGDANDVLYREYKSNGLTDALKKHLNAHSQYFQTLLSLGLIGFIGLILHFWLLFKRYYFEKYYFSLFFLLLTALNFLVESMFQVEAGTVFYAFFLSLILFSEKPTFKSLKLNDTILSTQD